MSHNERRRRQQRAIRECSFETGKDGPQANAIKWLRDPNYMRVYFYVDYIYSVLIFASPATNKQKYLQLTVARWRGRAHLRTIYRQYFSWNAATSRFERGLCAGVLQLMERKGENPELVDQKTLLRGKNGTFRAALCGGNLL